MNMLDDVRFWMQVLRDSKRTIYCSPEMESRVKTMIDAHGLSGILTVEVRRFLADNTIYVIDHQGIDAEPSKPTKFKPSWKPQT